LTLREREREDEGERKRDGGRERATLKYNVKK
jgi:hypothetical protein